MALTKIKTGGLANNAVTDAKVADAITVTGAQTGITQVGTLTAGTWQGTAIASAYLDADTAHLSGTQTFSGAKTFSSKILVDNDAAEHLTLKRDGSHWWDMQVGSNGNLNIQKNGATDTLIINGSSGDATFDGDVNINGGILKLSSSAQTDIHLTATTGTSRTWRILTDNNHGLDFYNDTGSAYALRFDTSNNATFSGATTINTSDSEQLMFKGATSPYLRFYESTTAKAYMQWHSDGYLNLENSEASTNLAVGANGIGIGTTSPDYELDVESSGQADIRAIGGTQARLILTDTGGTSGARNWDIKVSEDVFQIRNLADDYGSVENTPFTASTSGKVGINEASPKGMLDIDASSLDAAGDLDDPNDYAIVIRNNSTTDTGNGIAFTNDGADNVGGAILHIDKGSNNLGDLAFFTNANNSGNPGERLRITSAGKVGIGTASPSDYSSSADNLVIYDANHAGITIASPTDKSGSLFFADGTSGDSEYEGFIQYDHGNNVTDAMMIGTAGVERMRINSGGNVGIGDTSPDYRLDVEGDDPGSYIASFTNDGDSENRYGVRIQCGHDNASDTNFAITIADGDGGEQGYVTFTSGTITWGAFTANHDAELPSSDNSDGYPYGTLVETENLFYTKNHDGSDLERGIRYKVKKTSSAYSKKILGAYAGKYPTDMYENQHQIYVLGDGHILCNGEKGNIEIGDGICTSSTDGEGMKADKMAMIIGIAQEDVSFSGSESKLVAVQYGLQQFTPWDNA